MSYFHFVFLAIVQGITEFLPISSSGHLVIFQVLFGFEEPPIVFDTIVHFGTMFAVLIFFRKEIKKIIQKLFLEIKNKKKGEATHLVGLLFVGTIPIVIAGVLLEEKIAVLFNSLSLVGFSLLVTALILFLTKIIRKKKKEIKKTNFKDAVFVGLFQALAILPGVSRSGSTISGGLFRGLKREDAFNFSFFLGVIAIFGATIFHIPKIAGFSSFELTSGIIGFFVSAFVGFLSIKILKSIVMKDKLYYFGFYCLFLGIVLLFISFV